MKPLVKLLAISLRQQDKNAFCLNLLDSRLRGNDELKLDQTFPMQKPLRWSSPAPVHLPRKCANRNGRRYV